MTDRPYLLIDVDGVLNALCCQYLPAGGKTCPVHRGWIVSTALGFPLLLNPEHGPKLLEIAEETGAELAWGSTWEHHANEYIGPKIGLPPLPYAPVVRGSQKALTVVPWTEGRPFVWLDDDTTIPAVASRLASQRHVVIATNERHGLTDSSLELARAFLFDLRS